MNHLDQWLRFLTVRQIAFHCFSPLNSASCQLKNKTSGIKHGNIVLVQTSRNVCAINKVLVRAVKLTV